MNVVLQWLTQRALLLYLVCLLGAVGYAATALAARRKREIAQFSLEKEIAQQQGRRAWAVAGLFLALGGVIFLTGRYIVPTLPASETETATLEAGLTPQPTTTATPTITPSPTITVEVGITPETTPSPMLVESPTETPTPTVTPTPTPLPTAEPPSCPSPDVQIIAPAAAATVSGIVEVRGTAKINSFGYYKFEVQFPGSDTPNFIQQFDTPVENGILGYWDISNQEIYPPGGPYRFRLVAVDVYGNTTNCIIPLYIR